MIDEKRARQYCCEDISLIENYEKAIADVGIWHCHHRKETDEDLTQKQLIENNMYYGRPASELIFLTQFDHMSLHNKGSRNCNYHNPKAKERGRSISAALIASGSVRGGNNPAAKAVKCLETGEVFEYMGLAREKYHIGNCCSIVRSCNTGKPIRGRGLTFTWV